jgi:hypothetical protein
MVWAGSSTDGSVRAWARSCARADTRRRWVSSVDSGNSPRAPRTPTWSAVASASQRPITVVHTAQSSGLEAKWFVIVPGAVRA